jgi:hypothetical protein
MVTRARAARDVQVFFMSSVQKGLVGQVGVDSVDVWGLPTVTVLTKSRNLDKDRISSNSLKYYFI